MGAECVCAAVPERNPKSPPTSAKHLTYADMRVADFASSLPGICSRRDSTLNMNYDCFD